MKSFRTFLATSLLREYKRDITLQRMRTQLVQAASHDERQSPETVLDAFEAIDPTTNKQYIMWLIREYAKRQFRLKDRSRIHDVLVNFERVKSRLPNKDINTYTWDALEDTVNAIVSPQLGQKQSVEPYEIPADNKDDVDVLYNGPLGLLVVPKTEKASCELGRGTKWCTAKTKKGNDFDLYNKMGPLYIWREKNGDKYQFHFEMKEFKDAANQPIKPSVLHQFRTQHPVLKKLFKHVEVEILKTSITHSWVYEYARDVINGRWPEVEALIKTHPSWAYFYARDIIQGRWPEAETVIQTKSYVAYEYARYVIQGRWPEAEAVIQTDPLSAYSYARDVIQGRWPEAEAVIQTKSYQAYLYARDIIQGRWPEAEAAIKKMPSVWSDYKRFLRSKNIPLPKSINIR